MDITETQANDCMNTICNAVCSMIGHTMNKANVEDEKVDEIVFDLTPTIYTKVADCFVTVCEIIGIDNITF